jgi:hypothetical protein
VEDQFHGIDVADLTRLDERPHSLYATHKTVRQVHPEETIGYTSGIHDTACFGSRAPQRFLTEHRYTSG